MNFLDILSLSLSFLGISGLVLSLRYLIPCYFIPFLSARLDEAQQLLNHAEEIDAIPPESEHRTDLDLYEYLYAVGSSSHTSMQFGERICCVACREQSRAGSLSANASLYSAWLDLPSLYALLSNTGNEVKP